MRNVAAKSERTELLESIRRIWSEALAYFPELHSLCSWVDVGAHTWREIDAITGESGENLAGLKQVLGIELLGHRWISWFETVRARALKNAAALRERGVKVEYCTGDFASPDITERVREFHPDLVTFFYPFVAQETAAAWGLRRSQFRSFEALLEAAERVKPRALLSVHQGEWEAQEAEVAYLRVFGQSVWSRARSVTVTCAPVHDAVLWYLPLA